MGENGAGHAIVRSSLELTLPITVQDTMVSVACKTSSEAITH